MLARSLLTAVAAVTSCEQRSESSSASESAEKTYRVQGIVRGIYPDRKQIKIEHEEIPSFMPAMTMTFNARSLKEMHELAVGDPIEFTLSNDTRFSTIHNVQKINPEQVRLPRKAKPSQQSSYLKEGDQLPDFSLIDSDGKGISRQQFSGKPLLLTFIFTRCPVPDYCPLMSRQFQEVQQKLRHDAMWSEKLQLLSISFDPQFDTPEVLAQYAKAHGADTMKWRFATGSPEEIRSLTSAFRVNIESEDETIDHGLATALINPQGRIFRVWRGNGWRPEEVLQALEEMTPHS